ncbi:hypothetical protein CRE_20110 [Caenorhabditis remanei]|uniref:Uncharacterized protein n=1 Tax=Caenorhabditis remanei TaxID=31234 RepID=E3NP58_CAERE|nr:hypothetical protein CRE_20110 [Caenorhabditis remanei]
MFKKIFDHFDNAQFLSRIFSIDIILSVMLFMPSEKVIDGYGIYSLWLVFAYFGINGYVTFSIEESAIRQVDYYKRNVRVAIIGTIIYLISHFIILYSLDPDGWTHYTIFCLLNVFYLLFYVRYTWKVKDISGFNLRYGYGIGPAVIGMISYALYCYQNFKTIHALQFYTLLHCIYDFCLTFKYFCVELPDPEETLLQRIKTE